MPAKYFPLGAVLSVTTDTLLCDMDDLFNILNHMTGDNLMIHQLVRAGDVCKEPLLAQHPALRTVSVPRDLRGKDSCVQWLDTMSATLGDRLPVEPLESWRHRNPMDELLEMKGWK